MKSVCYAAFILFLSLSFCVNAQKKTARFSYNDAWKQIHKFQKDGRPKSARKVAWQIHNHARQEHNGPQTLKAIMAIEQFNSDIEEKADSINISFLKKEIKENPQPEKAILQNLLAKNYQDYYNQNGWRIDERTNLDKTINDSDYYTWDSKKFNEVIRKTALESISDKALLQKTPVREYTAVLDTSEGSARLRPTLYDLLVHNVIGLVAQEKPDVLYHAYDSIPVVSYYWFLISPVAQQKWYDSRSSYVLALRLYHDLEKFHEHDANPEAFVVLDLERLKFIKDHTESPAKNDEYYNSLKALEDKFSSDAASAEVGYERADFISNGYRPDKKDTSKYLKQIALEILDSYIKKFPKSFGGINCAVLKGRILEKQYDPSVADNILPGKQDVLNLKYKNVNKVYYRIIQLSDKEIALQNSDKYTTKKILERSLTLPVKLKGSFDLALPPDHEFHNAEVLLPAMDLGNYTILLSDGENLTVKNSRYARVRVTSLKAFLQSALTNHKGRLYVVEGDNGAPVEGANVSIQIRQYQKILQSQKSVTNKDGYVEIDDQTHENYRYYDFIVTKGNDKLVIRDHYAYYYYDRSKTSDTIHSHYYTDRAIYRPGQTVFFKGILVQTNPDNTKTMVIPNKKTVVYLYDVNEQKTDSITLTSNEFGSVSGSFKLASSVLNGNFTVGDYHGSVGFNVEEYKRPKFEISFLPVYKTYRLHDSITIEGTAIAYSGSSLDNAKVSYTVKPDFNSSSSVLLFSGNVNTDANGHFKITFKADPYRSESRMYSSTVSRYTYSVEAAITDINGETHSESTTVNAAPQSLNATITSSSFNVNNHNELSLTPEVHNLDNKEVSVNGTLKIDKLIEPSKRYWSELDQNKSVYEEDEETGDQPETKTEPKEKIEKNYISLATLSNKEIKIDAARMQTLPQGKYRVTYTTKDTFGNEVVGTNHFIIYDPEQKQVVQNKLIYSIPVKTSNLEPGQKAGILVGSAVKEYVHALAEHDGKIIFDQIIALNNNQQLLEIPILEGYRGGIKLKLFTYADNHNFLVNYDLPVPFRSKNLQIKTSVFHSSLMPGQKETWKLSIKGPNAEKLSAELMATLYDASLDAYRSHYWFEPDYHPLVNNLLTLNTLTSESNTSFTGLEYSNYTRRYYELLEHNFDVFEWDFGNKGPRIVRENTKTEDIYYYEGLNDKAAFSSFRGNVFKEKIPSPKANFSIDYVKPGVFSVQLDPNDPYNIPDSILTHTWSPGTNIPKITPRKNLQELAFFYPQLKTNDSGEVEISFTIPEALTKWKFMALAHTKDLMTGDLNKYAITQKQLMVQPNTPRFLREGDVINFTTKVTNMSESAQDVTVTLQLLNPYDEKVINSQLADNQKQLTQKIHINAKSNQPVVWTLKIPKGMDGFMYRITAANTQFSDGEEGVVPVLPNRILVTESMPMFVRGNQTKEFKFKNITGYSSLPSLSPYLLNLEMTANPAWYAIQALPYLMQFPHECNEQLFERFFANTVASYVVKKEPKIKEVFQSWKKGDGKALESNLQKNPEVKDILLAETPWVQDAENETERKKRIGLLFDDSAVNKGLNDAITKLEQNQLADGSWPWFPGMKGDRDITGYICSGIGRLEQMKIYTDYTDRLRAIGVKAFQYLDNEMKKDYDDIQKSRMKKDDDYLSSFIVNYLYARTFWKVPIDIPYEHALYYWLQQASNHWQNRPLMDKAMLVSAMYRQDEEKIARKIWNSIDEHALHSDEMGMYWKENTGGYGFYNNAVQTQAMLIEAYNDMLHTNLEPLDEMKLWLLKQKQTHNWNTTTGTADAVYALLLRGKESIIADKQVIVTIGGNVFDSKTASKEAGTGYFSHTWKANEISPKLGEVKLEKKDDGAAWGAVHFQYYQDLDKIKNFSGPINIRKEVFLQENTKDGAVLKSLDANTVLHTGDLVKVRIEIRLDRDMEYIHLKDLRAGALEPVDMISGYRYGSSLGYYQDIKDASMNFFFDHISPGTYVFEYDLRATQTGEFQNGIATIENMYAPEFKSHTDGVRIEVK
jgi:hypothetical protein